jgi:23S rRNA (cytidine1920-2'-O)/16S rRNA (cytidine1409-2'-O)-methyltransferase
VSGKKRIDILLVEKGFAPSRTRAQELVRGGFVRAEGALIFRPAVEVAETARLEVTGDVHPM